MSDDAMPTPALAEVSLDDKFTRPHGPALMTGMQALVRLALHLHDRGRRQGRRLGGYISGYRGSPVGTFDMALWSAREHLERRDIRFQPGVNEDLAATAVWGSQQVHLLGESEFDGVFGLWYGKAPGVDRSLDVFRHANCAGTAPWGGVLAIAGDDPNAVSSTVTGCSDHDFVSVGMPLLYPASVQEMLDLGVLGIEMSRASGCWVAMKAVTDIAESTAIVDVDPERVPLDWPQPDPAAEVHIRWPDQRVEQEQRLYTVKLPQAIRFARQAGLNRRVLDPAGARVGIVSAGKPWADLMQAFQDLGLSHDELAARGVRLLKLGMIYPLDAQEIAAFAEGLDTLLVVEEKRGFIEDQVKSLLFGAAARPQVLGKRDGEGRVLIPEHGELSPALVAEVLDRVLPPLCQGPAAQARLAALRHVPATVPGQAALQSRTPYFCSGCPHNTSTRVPEGSLALAGIGCHWLALFMDRGNQTFTQMGGEGCTWLGAKDFSRREHVFVNMGDGTYHHSGLLAVRAAVHARANMTYKLLYNDAVAMTGGQPVSEGFTPQQIARQLLAEGVSRVVVVSDHPEKYRQGPAPQGGFPAGVTLHGRDELDGVQRELQRTPGVTALVYDQTCAAEKRRRRKRGTLDDPDVRAFIHEAVCEGCGDCSVQSNCISVEPLETEFGRKRRINQSSCNKDLKCVDGFCPSFVTLEGAVPRKARGTGPAPDSQAVPLARPQRHQAAPVHETVITGIGGTGVITIGAILAMAARLEGRAATCLDQTGIAQKNGAVLSHVRIAAAAGELHAPRVARRNADLVLGCDMMVAASAPALATIQPGVTQVVLNTHLAPNAAFVLDPVHAEFGAQDLHRVIADSSGPAQVHGLAATELATRQFGDAIAANMIVLGFALQRGWLPVSLEALQQAIEINGVAVKANLAALDAGRRAARDEPVAAREAVPAQPVTWMPRTPEPLEALIARRRADLQAYQDAAYAGRYEAVVRRVQQAEQRAVPGSQGLARAVAVQAHRAMAFKDEYEVARLYTDGRFERALAEQFEGKLRLSFHLAPPGLSRRDPVTGQLRKRRFGPWMLPAMRLLARMKGLRGSLLDPFGHTAERRQERLLARTYLEMAERMADSLEASNHRRYVELASLTQAVRGFGHVKEAKLRDLAARWRAAAAGTPLQPGIDAFAEAVRPAAEALPAAAASRT